MDATQSARNGLERPRDRWMAHRLRLELCDGALKVGECRLGMRRGLRSSRTLDLMQRAHRLSDGRGEVE